MGAVGSDAFVVSTTWQAALYGGVWAESVHFDAQCLIDVGSLGIVPAGRRIVAAHGFKQIPAIEGTASLWSPEVLRVGMSAHFCLRVD